MASSIAVNSDRFCDSTPLESIMNCRRPTLNQSLAGLPNERTKIPPVIVAPIMELNYWSGDSTRRFSQINSRVTKYPRTSGWESCAVPLQPNIYTLSEVSQPINSTNGIAITPQFPEHTYNIKGEDAQIFVDTNAGISYVTAPPPEPSEIPIGKNASKKPASEQKKAPALSDMNQPIHVTKVFDYCEPNLANVYDPRFSGYGPSDRGYKDERLGNTRYFYDDVNAIRMPNYITRSKIDSCINSCGDSYGDVEAGNLNLNEIRPLVEKDWMDNSLHFREELMRSLMRKRNEELVQNRVAPKYTLW